MKRLTTVTMIFAGMICGGAVPSVFAQTSPLRIDLQVTPVNFVGGCPENLTLSVTVSAPAPRQVYVQFAGSPILSGSFWLGGQNQILPLQANRPPFNMTVSASASGWVQADVVTFSAGSPQANIVASSSRVNYAVRCIAGMPPDANAQAPLTNGTMYVGGRPVVINSPRPNVPYPASQPPHNGPSLPPNPPPPYAASTANQASPANQFPSQHAPVQLPPAQKTQLAPPQPQANTKLQQLAAQARQNFLKYRAQFQLQQVEQHISRVDALLRQSSCAAGCQNALQADLQVANRLHAAVQSTMRPVGNLGETLMAYRGTSAPSQAPQVRESGGTSGSSNSSCVAPQITSVTPSSGQPGDTIMINGSGLANPHWTTLLVKGMYVQMNLEFSNDSQIIASIDPRIGLIQQPIQAYIYVNTCAQSNAENFTFRPQIDVGLLPVTQQNVTWGDFTCGIDHCKSFPWVNPVAGCNAYIHGQGWGGGCFPGYPPPNTPQGFAGDEVAAGSMSGRRADDQFFYQYQLQNGWTVDHVDFYNGLYGEPAQTPNSSSGCSLSNQPAGTSPYTDVHCWVTPNAPQAVYMLGIYVHGPAGLAPPGLITQ